MTDRRLDGTGARAVRISEGDWAAVLEGNGGVLFSDGWKDMLGYAQDGAGDSLDEWSSLVHPDDRPRVMADLQRHCCGETPTFSTEHRMRCKDGSYKWVHDRGKISSRAPDGGSLRFLGIQADVTARKQVEDALRRSEERYALVERGTQDGIWDWNILTNEDYLSPRWKAMLGFTDDDVPNHADSFFSRIHPDDVPGVHEALRAHLDHRRPYNIELRLRHKDGHYRWFQSRGDAGRHWPTSPHDRLYQRHHRAQMA
ncbi:MAG: PAS domain-containing protein [Nitrospirota bacterium]